MKQLWVHKVLFFGFKLERDESTSMEYEITTQRKKIIS